VSFQKLVISVEIRGEFKNLGSSPAASWHPAGIIGAYGPERELPGLPWNFELLIPQPLGKRHCHTRRGCVTLSASPTETTDIAPVGVSVGRGF
jgi:hypothetical protein